MQVGDDRSTAASRWGGFPSTHWSLIGRAGEATGEPARAALGELLVRYLPALRAHLVARMRLATDRAEDLLQGFIADKVLERHLLAAADRERGKFRTFLLTALHNYVISDLRREGADRRRPKDGQVEHLDEEADVAGAPDQPSAAFDVAWAREVIAQTVRRMEAECAASNRPDIWGVFECRILKPVLEEAPPLAYEALVERFGFRSPMAASNVLITGKRMFVRLLRAVVAEYAAGPQDVEEELGDLERILSRGA